MSLTTPNQEGANQGARAQLLVAAALMLVGSLMLLFRDVLALSTGAPPLLVAGLAVALLLEGLGLLLLVYLRGMDRGEPCEEPSAKDKGLPAPDDARMISARSIYDQTSARLRNEIDSLARRGNLNLTIGVLTSTSAVGVLIFIAWSVNASFGGINQLLGYYIPRVMTAVFIEVFSFFFLRLYKSSLAEIKYYQNELTDLAQQQAALEVTQGGRDAALTTLITEYLMKERRNGCSELGTSGGDSITTEGIKDFAPFLEQLGKLIEVVRK